MSITELAIKRPSAIIVIFTVLGFLGIFAYTKLNYELLPKITQPVITVYTYYPGASPREVEATITKELENGLSNLENLYQISSVSMEAVSEITLSLDPDADVDRSLQDVQIKINRVQLPTNAQRPLLSKMSFSDAPIMRMGVSAQMNPQALYAMVKDEILPVFSKIKGAATVTIIGGEERAINVFVNKRLAEQLGITILQINQAISTENIELPAGKISNDNSQITIQLKGKYQSISDLNKLVLAVNPATGSKIRLMDVATIIDGIKETKTFTRINGQNSIGILIQKQGDANAVKLSAAIKNQIQHLEKRYEKQQLKFEISADSSLFTLAAANALFTDLGLAVFIVALCMLVFLHSFRNAFIVMIAIPASLISVSIALFLLGYSLNLMTLLAISLVVGILVDDSIVVLENIHRHLEMGKNKTQAALDGRAEIGFTALSITLVDVVVFLPLVLVGGLISDLMAQFSVVIVLSTLMSLFVSFTLTPLLASRMAKVHIFSNNNIQDYIIGLFEKFIAGLTNVYNQLLLWSLAHKRILITGMATLLLSSYLLISQGFIGSEFISSGDKSEFMINLELAPTATLKQTSEITQKAEAHLFKNKNITDVFSSIGTTSAAGNGAGSTPYIAELNVKLVPKANRKHNAEIFAQLTKLELEKILPGTKITSAAVSITGGADEAPVKLTITGVSADENSRVAAILLQKLKTLQGTSEVKLSTEQGIPQLSVQINREKLAELGLSMNVVGSTLQNAFIGNTDAKYTEMGKDYDIQVSYDQFNRQNYTDLNTLSFTNQHGNIIRLNQFAKIAYTSSSTKIERKNRIPSIEVLCQVIGISSGQITSQMKEYIAQQNFGDNISIEFEGDAQNMGEAFTNLTFAILASILFVYLIMVLLYNSFIYPFVVLFSIPVALIGALLALALSMQTLNVFSLLGMVMLIGLVAKNAILIVDFTNQLKAQGKNTVDALLISGKTRLRPILMTTLSMITGMLPIALSAGPGAEWKNGLAWVLIGGLTSSMLLTLLLVPAVYLIVDIAKGDIKNAAAKEWLQTNTLN
jgi:hydrophobic/amphiphilic exporter-1 (mainly G- bacteria), HAE1 family